MDGYMLMQKIRGPPPPVTTTRVLRMERRLGDRLTDETGEWRSSADRTPRSVSKVLDVRDWLL
jgi:hypothetical protein